MKKKVVIIGAGFSGLSAACFMAKAGFEVSVIEKHSSPGGRARQVKSDGFTFDMGPSWYWMPDVFERFFQQFNKNVTDYYKLKRIDPSYRIYWQKGFSDIPAELEKLKELFEVFEKGSAVKLNEFLNEASIKYEIGMRELVYMPGLSIKEFINWKVLKNIFKLNLFTSIKKHVFKYFKDDRIRKIIEFPVLFLGALPENTPALYSLMNYADIIGGTWYPEGGMYQVVQSIYEIALELGIQFRFNEEVKSMHFHRSSIKKIISDKANYELDVVISTADYEFTESHLLPPDFRSYSPSYWNKRTMAPSCIMFYLGINKKLEGVLHHSLFFDAPFQNHAEQIFSMPKWPNEPLFYLSVSSKTDDKSAPEGCENVVILIPIASGLKGDNEQLRDHYFNIVMDRLEKRTGHSIRDSIIYKKSYSVTDFENDYHSFRGNAYGLANTLRQTAIFRPSCKSKKVKNLFYAGQLTIPGPGVPPSLISGEVVSKQVIKMFNQYIS